jgi:hypothetical protein
LKGEPAPRYLAISPSVYRQTLAAELIASALAYMGDDQAAQRVRHVVERPVQDAIMRQATTASDSMSRVL